MQAEGSCTSNLQHRNQCQVCRILGNRPQPDKEPSNVLGQHLTSYAMTHGPPATHQDTHLCARPALTSSVPGRPIMCFRALHNLVRMPSDIQMFTKEPPHQSHAKKRTLRGQHFTVGTRAAVHPQRVARSLQTGTSKCARCSQGDWPETEARKHVSMEVALACQKTEAGPKVGTRSLMLLSHGRLKMGPLLGMCEKESCNVCMNVIMLQACQGSKNYHLELC